MCNSFNQLLGMRNAFGVFIHISLIQAHCFDLLMKVPFYLIIKMFAAWFCTRTIHIHRFNLR